MKSYPIHLVFLNNENKHDSEEVSPILYHLCGSRDLGSHIQ